MTRAEALAAVGLPPGSNVWPACGCADDEDGDGGTGDPATCLDEVRRGGGELSYGGAVKLVQAHKAAAWARASKDVDPAAPAREKREALIAEIADIVRRERP